MNVTQLKKKKKETCYTENNYTVVSYLFIFYSKRSRSLLQPLGEKFLINQRGAQLKKFGNHCLRITVCHFTTLSRDFEKVSHYFWDVNILRYKLIILRKFVLLGTSIVAYLTETHFLLVCVYVFFPILTQLLPALSLLTSDTSWLFSAKIGSGCVESKGFFEACLPTHLITV